ncbi:hypothetical protein AH782_09655 [Salmonella enterica subsp. enterica]|nr:hypothetical protein [Salmonella enterica subsp. enterica serovar Rubislaw]
MNGIKNPDYYCYLQTPDDMKGKEKGYPYFDFAAIKPPAIESGSVLGSESSQPISVVCVDFEKGIDINSQSFKTGISLPIMFFFLGICISSIYKTIKRI